MIDINIAVQRLAFHEGCRLEPYKDHLGYWTIGIGRCYEKNPITKEEEKVIGTCWEKGITKNGAYYLLRNDIKRCIKELEKKIPFWKTLSDERQYALLDMAFQLGSDGLLEFRKMLSALGVGNYAEARRQCLDSKYARQTPIRANRIANCLASGRFLI